MIAFLNFKRQVFGISKNSEREEQVTTQLPTSAIPTPSGSTHHQHSGSNFHSSQPSVAKEPTINQKTKTNQTSIDNPLKTIDYVHRSNEKQKLQGGYSGNLAQADTSLGPRSSSIKTMQRNGATSQSY